MGVAIDQELKQLEIGKSEIMKEGKDVLIIGVGQILYDAAKACEEIGCNATIINARFVKPLDSEAIIKYAKKFKSIITLEESCSKGGFGSAVVELLNENKIKSDVHIIGIPDEFVEHGKPDIQKKIAGIDRESIKNKLRQILGK